MRLFLYVEQLYQIEISNRMPRQEQLNKAKNKASYLLKILSNYSFFASFQYLSNSSNLQSAICLPCSFTLDSI